MFVTITYKEAFNLNELKAYALLNRFLHFVNVDLYGKRYKQKGRFLTGYGCCEFQRNGSPHFHLLMNNNNQDINKVLDSMFKKLTKFPQTTLRGFNVQSPISEQAAASYLTKTVHDLNQDRIFPIDKDGACWIA